MFIKDGKNIGKWNLKEKIIGVHPNDNIATLWLKVKDLINIIKEYENQVNIVEL